MRLRRTRLFSKSGASPAGPGLSGNVRLMIVGDEAAEAFVAPLVTQISASGYGLVTTTSSVHVGVATASLTDGALATRFAGTTPDILVIHSGSVDGPAAHAGIVTGLTKILTAARARNPNVRVWVCQIINSASTLAYLAAVMAWAEDASNAASSVSLIDCATGFNAGTMLLDAIRPNGAGAAFINGKVMTAIAPYLTPLASRTPALFGVGVTAAAPTVVELEFSKPLDLAALPALSAFTLGGTLTTAKTASSIAGFNLDTRGYLRITYSSNFTGNDVPTTSYAVPGSSPLRDTDGLSVAAFSAVQIAVQMDDAGQLVVSLGDNSMVSDSAPHIYGTRTDGETIPAYSTRLKYQDQTNGQNYGRLVLEENHSGWFSAEVLDLNAARRMFFPHKDWYVAGMVFMEFAAGVIRMKQSSAPGTNSGVNFDSGVITLGTYTFTATGPQYRWRYKRECNGDVLGRQSASYSTDGGGSWTEFAVSDRFSDLEMEFSVWVLPQGTGPAGTISGTHFPLYRPRAFGAKGDQS